MKTFIRSLIFLIAAVGAFAEGRADSSERTYTITAGIGLNDKSAQESVGFRPRDRFLPFSPAAALAKYCYEQPCCQYPEGKKIKK